MIQLKKYICKKYLNKKEYEYVSNLNKESYLYNSIILYLLKHRYKNNKLMIKNNELYLEKIKEVVIKNITEISNTIIEFTYFKIVLITRNEINLIKQ